MVKFFCSWPRTDGSRGRKAAAFEKRATENKTTCARWNTLSTVATRCAESSSADIEATSALEVAVAPLDSVAVDEAADDRLDFLSAFAFLSPFFFDLDLDFGSSKVT